MNMRTTLVAVAVSWTLALSPTIALADDAAGALKQFQTNTRVVTGAAAGQEAGGGGAAGGGAAGGGAAGGAAAGAAAGGFALGTVGGYVLVGATLALVIALIVGKSNSSTSTSTTTATATENQPFH